MPARSELTVQAGLISLIAHPERKVSYAELMGGKPFNLEVSGECTAEGYQRPIPLSALPPRGRIFPARWPATPALSRICACPACCTARLVRPPSPAAEFIAMDESSVAGIARPGQSGAARQFHWRGGGTRRTGHAGRAESQGGMAGEGQPAAHAGLVHHSCVPGRPRIPGWSNRGISKRPSSRPPGNCTPPITSLTMRMPRSGLRARWRMSKRTKSRFGRLHRALTR